MAYKVIMQSEEYDDIFGHHEAYCKEFNIPYKLNEDVWYCYKRGKKYVVRETFITGIWATNIAGVALGNGWHVAEDRFNRIFRDKNEAIDWCIKENQRNKVKVYKRNY